ncbi:MAG: peptidylprolyl isomerase [Acidiferrobacterales bacterium]
MVHIKTVFGVIVIELDQERAPNTVANFLRYIKENFYNGTIFHRVIDNFVIQGGGFEPGMVQKATHDPIENEANNGLRNARGSVAMARTNDPNSATSQFFINIADNDFLNFTTASDEGWGYCVFGTVVDGLNVLDQLKGVPTTSRFGFKDVPLTDVMIQQIDIINID